MKKTWGQVKSECINLGFEKSTAYQRTPSLFLESVNRAMVMIEASVKPLIGSVTIEHEPMGNPAGFTAYDLAQLAEDFRDFADYAPVMDGYVPVRGYRTEQKSLLLLPNDVQGAVTAYYRKYPAQITAATPDSYEIELDYDAAGLVPLLASYYIWLDDDERKAVMYRNDFEDRRADILATKTPRTARVVYDNTTGWW